nr:MAG TPA: hypothetical protein [Bacteriophage sp.]
MTYKYLFRPCYYMLPVIHCTNLNNLFHHF